MTRENASVVINEMPLEFDVDVLIERLLFLEKVEVARLEVKEGKTYTHQEVKAVIEKWHK